MLSTLRQGFGSDGMTLARGMRLAIRWCADAIEPASVELGMPNLTNLSALRPNK
jgi:hypothetical protein